MRFARWWLIGLAVLAVALAGAEAAPKKKTAAASKTGAAKVVKVPPTLDEPIVPSPDAARVTRWIAASGDNHGLPYMIVDKTHAALFLFDAAGAPLASEPVLVGIAPGDTATPGIGAKKLSEIGPAEKTTPAGRFLAKFGLALGRERILWVDYATSVALHPIPADVGAKEHRRERMLSPTPDDNRITFGCINVPRALYGKTLSPLFRNKGGYVYVLPDSLALEQVFPQLMLRQYAG